VIRAVLGTFRRKDEAPPPWSFIVAVLVGGLIARLVAIAAYRYGGDDLTVYTYFSRLLLNGQNPFDAPEAGAVDPVYADNPTGELGLFAAVLQIYDSRTALRLFFVVADLTTVLTVAFLFRRPTWWRAHLMLLLAFNPFILVRWHFYGADKTVLFLWITLLIAFLEQERHALAWTATTILGILKWMSAYIVLPLAAFTASRRGPGRALLAVALSFLAVAVTTIPFFPDSLDPWHHRQDRLDHRPDHESVTRLLDAVGLWDPLIVKIFVPAALIAIFVLFVVDRIDIREAVVLSLAASLILLPDITRTEFIAVPFLLIMRLTRWRLAAIWVAAALSAVATVGASNKASTLPFSSILERLFDSTEYEGSLFYVFVINLFLFVVIALYAADRLRGRVDVELSHDLRFHPPGGAARRPDPTVAAALD
jgi:hypothetical protein